MASQRGEAAEQTAGTRERWHFRCFSIKSFILMHVLRIFIFRLEGDYHYTTTFYKVFWKAIITTQRYFANRWYIYRVLMVPQRDTYTETDRSMKRRSAPRAVGKGGPFDVFQSNSFILIRKMIFYKISWKAIITTQRYFIRFSGRRLSPHNDIL